MRLWVMDWDRDIVICPKCHKERSFDPAREIVAHTIAGNYAYCEKCKEVIRQQTQH